MTAMIAGGSMVVDHGAVLGEERPEPLGIAAGGGRAEHPEEGFSGVGTGHRHAPSCGLG
ncbi:hypothetical protein EV378_5926 [Pseudonocardia endophytica]|uniref:Uncharacterized protein n=1 Tax=Pseudonocardia endophytica TaxID=401976 RepID=A0A4R1HI42_PSEEN|nr:hypothetical protein EV378_5926 [Pseudonocardia endophytica]